jgi:hypothetical protein
LFACKEHGLRVAQSRVDGPGPSKPFFKVLEGEAILKPWV